jgi:hypothetical protein
VLLVCVVVLHLLVPLSVHVLSVVCIVTSSKFDAYTLVVMFLIVCHIVRNNLVPPVVQFDASSE